jgi:hypothetical protein
MTTTANELGEREEKGKQDKETHLTRKIKQLNFFSFGEN